MWFKILWLFATGKRQKARSLFIIKTQRLLKRYYSLRKNTGIFVVDEPWDCLIILDACRYDYFAREYHKFLQGDLQKRRSRGSSTSDWLLKNFTRFYPDIVYVSGNPHCSDRAINGFLGTDHFHAIEHVWKYAWDEEVDSIRPDDMVRAALEAKKRYPGKRIIVHFIQPHGPWIGDTRISIAEVSSGPAEKSTVDGKWITDKHVWEMVRQGMFDVPRLKRAYTDNLLVALRSVRDLVDRLDGRIVVSADHGEAFGDRLVVEHPSGIYCSELVEVPWLVIDKKVSSQRPPDFDAAGTTPGTRDVSEEVVAKRLRALGYID
jgi:hypothetical protein